MALLHRRRAVRVKGRDGRQAPGLTFLALGLAPDDWLASREPALSRAPALAISKRLPPGS